MLIILLFLLITLFGFLYNYHFLRMRNAIYLFSFSYISGLSIYLLLLYIFSPFFSIYHSSLIILILLVISSIYFFFRNGKILNSVQYFLSRSELVKLILCLLFIVFFTYLSTQNNVILDFKFHVSVANGFLKANKFSIGYLNSPTLMIPYHFAFDFLSASISSILKINVINVFQIIVIFSAIFTFLGAYSISYFLSEEFDLKKKSYLLSAMFFYFSGNLVFFDSIFHAKGGLFETICARGLHGSIFNDIGSSVIFLPSLTLGFPMFSFLFFLIFLYLKEGKQSFKLLGVIFILGLVLFQCAEYILFILLLTFSFSFIFQVKNYKYLFLIFNFILIIVLNKVAFALLSSTYSYMPSFLDITANPYFPMFTAFGRFGNLSEFRKISLFSWDLFQEIGLQFIFLLFVLFKLINNKNYLSKFLIFFFLISFIAPFLLYIKSSPSDSLRILHPGLDILALLFILFLDKFNFKSILIIFIIPSILKLLLSSVFTNAIYLNPKYTHYVSSSIGKLIIDKNYKEFVEEIRLGVKSMKSLLLYSDSEMQATRYIKGDDLYGISNNQFPFGLIGLPAYVPRSGAICRGRTFLTVLDTFDPKLIKELKIGWLYVDDDTDKYINKTRLKYFIDNGFIKQIVNLNDEFNLSESVLYKFNQDFITSEERKYFWTLTKYIIDEPFPVDNTLYIFNSEKDANDFIKKRLLSDLRFSKDKFFTNAVSVDLINAYANEHSMQIRFN